MLKRWFPSWSKSTSHGSSDVTASSAADSSTILNGQSHIRGLITKNLAPVSEKSPRKRAGSSDVVPIKDEEEDEVHQGDSSDPRPAKVRKLNSHHLKPTIPRANIVSTSIDSDQLHRAQAPALGEDASREVFSWRPSVSNTPRPLRHPPRHSTPSLVASNRNGGAINRGETVIASIEQGEESLPQPKSPGLGEWDFVKRETSEDHDGLRSKSSEETDVDSDVPDEWRREQNLLSMVLRARNEFSMMPSTWKHHFLGIPIPEELFYRKVKAVSSRPRIYSHFDDYEFRVWRALSQIAHDHADIRDLRRDQLSIIRDKSKLTAQKQRELAFIGKKMFKKVNAAFVQAITFSRLDGDIEKYGDALPSNIQIIEISGAEASHNEIITAMKELAEEWRDRFDQLRDEIPEGEHSPNEPVVFGLAIMNHFVFIVTLDASDPDARCHIPIKMDLTEHWQQWWNAIAVMATVCWARDKLMETAGQMKLQCSNDGKLETDVDA